VPCHIAGHEHPVKHRPREIVVVYVADVDHIVIVERITVVSGIGPVALRFYHVVAAVEHLVADKLYPYLVLVLALDDKDSHILEVVPSKYCP
jgi:hypothetical protein